jgi:hypothetical protein
MFCRSPRSNTDGLPSSRAGRPPGKASCDSTVRVACSEIGSDSVGVEDIFDISAGHPLVRHWYRVKFLWARRLNLWSYDDSRPVLCFEKVEFGKDFSKL